MLEKVGCEHIKTISKTDFNMNIEYIKKPSKEVLNATKRFFVEIWDKCGRQLAKLRLIPRRFDLRTCVFKLSYYSLP